jgi:DNA-directed RNA polymerase subunit RPC12/RpoP
MMLEPTQRLPNRAMFLQCSAMSSARFETIMDFGRLKVDAAIRCQGCGHTKNMTSAELGQAFGYGERVARAAKRLRCQECGRRGARLIPVPRLE